MMKEDKKEEFLRKCHEEYESKMEGYFFSATTTPELEQQHIEVKAQLVKDLPQKWRTEMGISKVSSSIQPKLIKKLDDAFTQLKKHFEKSRKLDNLRESATLAQQKALEFYTNEMDKYVRNRPNAAPKEITLHHNTVVGDAMNLAKSKGGTGLTSRLIADLRMEIEERLETYRTRAEINQKSLKDPAIGIDLGTTMCCVMIFHKGKVNVVQNRGQGNSSTTPSYVAFNKDGSDTFGLVAKENAYLHPETTIYDAKRMIGREWTDANLTADRKRWPFEIVNDNNNPKVKTWGRARFPHEVSARLLARFRIMAEEHLNLPAGSIRKAVITVPAYFTEPQRRATSEAAECAGLEILNILSEPTAAAIAYSWERRSTRGSRKALIYDLGGGTFDVAIANVMAGDVEILVVDGDTHLGGQDFDQILMEHCLQKFHASEGIDLGAGRGSDQKLAQDSSRTALSRLKLQCEKAKERLSTSNRQTITVDYIFEDKSLIVTVTKDELEELIKPLVQKTLEIVDRALENAREKGVSTKEDIDDVILVGGSTRVPLVEQMLSEYFGGKQLCKHINPDQAVAYGAAVQAAILNNDQSVKNISVQDVTPFSLGIEMIGRIFSPVIPKNSQIPCTKTRQYVTTRDNQISTMIPIYQGENMRCEENTWLGGFTFEGLLPRPAGEEKVDVTMTIDSQGILQVNAESCSTEKNSSITIKVERLGIDQTSMEEIKEVCQRITEI